MAFATYTKRRPEDSKFIVWSGTEQDPVAVTYPTTIVAGSRSCYAEVDTANFERDSDGAIRVNIRDFSGNAGDGNTVVVRFKSGLNKAEFHCQNNNDFYELELDSFNNDWYLTARNLLTGYQDRVFLNQDPTPPVIYSTGRKLDALSDLDNLAAATGSGVSVLNPSSNLYNSTSSTPTNHVYDLTTDGFYAIQADQPVAVNVGADMNSATFTDALGTFETNNVTINFPTGDTGVLAQNNDYILVFKDGATWSYDNLGGFGGSGVELPIMSATVRGAAKLGSGLKIVNNDTLEAEAYAAKRFTAADQAAMLLGSNGDSTAIPDLTICLRTDESRIYYLDANVLPSSAGNWIAGASTADGVTSWQGAGDLTPQTGAVVAKKGDYTGDQIVYSDKAIGNSSKYTIEVDAGRIYLVTEV